MKKIISLLVMVMMVSGCAISSRMNNLNVGMTKSEVIALMGKPASTSAIENKEVLRYKLYGDDTGIMVPGIYRVVIDNDKVKTPTARRSARSTWDSQTRRKAPRYRQAPRRCWPAPPVS